MDIICFCSVSVTIAALKLHCFSTLRRWKFSAYLLCVCMNVWELSQFPFQMSSYLRAGKQRQSQRPLFHGCSFRTRQEGGGPSAAIYGSAGIPPPWQGNPSLFTSRSAHTTGKLTGWWARRERGGDGRDERGRKEVSAAAMWAKVIIIIVIASKWRIKNTTRFSSTHRTYTWMSTCSHEHICSHVQVFIYKCPWRDQDFKKKWYAVIHFGNISCAKTQRTREYLHVWCQHVLCSMEDCVYVCVLWIAF